VILTAGEGITLVVLLDLSMLGLTVSSLTLTGVKYLGTRALAETEGVDGDEMKKLCFGCRVSILIVYYLLEEL
jgi:hypothetical protein